MLIFCLCIFMQMSKNHDILTKDSLNCIPCSLKWYFMHVSWMVVKLHNFLGQQAHLFDCMTTSEIQRIITLWMLWMGMSPQHGQDDEQNGKHLFLSLSVQLINNLSWQRSWPFQKRSMLLIEFTALQSSFTYFEPDQSSKQEESNLLNENEIWLSHI